MYIKYYRKNNDSCINEYTIDTEKFSIAYDKSICELLNHAEKHISNKFGIKVQIDALDIIFEDILNKCQCNACIS